MVLLDLQEAMDMIHPLPFLKIRFLPLLN